MIKFNIIKRSSSVLFFIILFLVIFVSCGSNQQKKVVITFLDYLKNERFEESMMYLYDNESKETYRKYIESLINMDNSDEDMKKIHDIIKNKVMDFTYSVGEVKKVTNEIFKVKVTINNFNLYDAYRKTLQHILLNGNGENLENTSGTSYIANLFVSYADSIERKSTDGEFTVVKRDNKYIIELNDEILYVLFSSYLEIISHLN
ncbi:hypothetical protein [Candidatus Arthromitus sp. SFB-rat-Yit]|uniref:hypothetical protein n=1 Tax=Candidatus Arthromitus sp. SFB-rat-Yit TaxID=1041504 RepID=UPI000227A37A|nr:hypothetical protein [Candidatus Arthromitus sp. SFB-rat-Yit]BAK80879.1 putative lipoprotein [Candidatus Arthromitus sp. SFB-rat-Yit]